MTLINTARSTIIIAAAAACTSLIATPAAHAGPVHPQLDFTIEVNGTDTAYSFDAAFAPTATSLPNGQWEYDLGAGFFESEFSFNPTFTIGSAVPQPLPAGILTGFAFQNTSNENLRVVITYTIETSFAAFGSAPWDTNLSIALNSGSTMTTFNGMPLWQVSIDGGTVGVLHPAPSTFFGPSSTDSDTSGFASTPTSDMAIQIAFEINPGGQLFFNGNFTMIPGPGSLALLALGGVVAAGRRRRTTVA